MPMTSKDLMEQTRQRHAAAMSAALKSGDPEQMNAAMAAYFNDVHDSVIREAAMTVNEQHQDNNILAARGVTVLTGPEMNYYKQLGEAFQAADPRMALENFDVAMPETIVDRVIETIQKSHPLLDAINFENVAYRTRVVLNAAPATAAAWGKITTRITQELTGALSELSMVQCKLTAFMCISQDLVTLGPQWVDRYMIASLSEAIALGVENSIVDGNGQDCPVGMTRVIPADAPDTGVAYERKEKVVLSDMSPQSWGPIVAKLAEDPLDETGTKARVIDANDLIFICHPLDYWQKIMPATTFRRPDGTWARDILPVPAKLLQSNSLAQGEAIIGLGKKYFLGLGPGGKKGVITTDDSVRFFEDERAAKAKLLGNGRPEDNNSFVLLDISGMLNYVAQLVKYVDSADA